MRWAALAASVPATMLYLGGSRASGAVTTLTSDDGFTTVTIDPTTNAGMTSMTINTVANNVQAQGYWFRTGSNAISPFSSLTLANTFTATLGSSVSTNPDDLTLTYTGSYTPSGGHTSNFTITVQYLMQDGGSTTGSLQELVSVENAPASGDVTSNIALPIDIFEYNHFTPKGDTTNEQVAIGPSDATDVGAGAGYNDAVQNNVLNGSSVAEDQVTPSPAFYDLGLASNPTTYFSGLGGNLPGDATVALGSNPTSPTGDVQWVFEWANDGADSIPIGGASPLISKLLTVTVPEPATASLLMGVMGVVALRRPRRRVVG
jgi:hypothetical protein